MRRLTILMFAAACAWTVSAAAEKPASSSASALPSLSGIGRSVPSSSARPNLAVPPIEYSGSEGSWERPRGIIAGRQVAPGTVLGLGIFQIAPTMRGYVGDMPPNTAPRRSRRAALGLSVRF